MVSVSVYIHGCIRRLSMSMSVSGISFGGDDDGGDDGVDGDAELTGYVR